MNQLINQLVINWLCIYIFDKVGYFCYLTSVCQLCVNVFVQLLS